MSNNTIILDECIEDFKTQNELSIRKEDVFELFSATLLTKNNEFSYEELENGVVDGSLDGGIDVMMIVIDDDYILSSEQISDIKFKDTTNVRLIICQSKWATTHTESTLDKIITSIPYIFELTLEEVDLSERFNESLIEKVLLFREVWIESSKKKSQIKIDYYYCSRANECKLDKSYLSKVEQIKTVTTSRVKNSIVNFSTYSASELLEVYQKSKSTELEIKFKEQPVSVTYGEGQIGYIGMSKLKDYYNFIRDSDGILREELFESNVRHYQGDVDVNSKIQETLAKDYKRDFWWLNNGITIIASNVGQYGKNLSLNDVQIVNGLQTSYTIGKHYQETEDDDRSILVKIIVNKDKETIDKIISSTNRQNPVSPTLLRATDDTQRKIEIYFEKKGYYYDRRKNFYKNQGKPSSKIFGIQTTAQAIHAIMNFEPAPARQKPTTLIKTDESYKKIFNPDIHFGIYLNCCLIAKFVSDYIKNELNTEDKSFAKSFRYHLCRIVTSNSLEKAYYSKNDLEKFNLSNLNDNLLETSLTELKSYYDDFQNEHSLPNLNTVTKSSRFQDAINKNLIDKF